MHAGERWGEHAPNARLKHGHKIWCLRPRKVNRGRKLDRLVKVILKSVTCLYWLQEARENKWYARQAP